MDRDDWPDSDDPEKWCAYNLRGAEISLEEPLFLHQLKFAVFSGRLGELLSRSDVPAMELRFGTSTILCLSAPIGEPLRIAGQRPVHFLGPIQTWCSSIAKLLYRLWPWRLTPSQISLIANSARASASEASNSSCASAETAQPRS